MIDGADKLLMEHRDRQVDLAAKRIAELEAENAALKTGVHGGEYAQIFEYKNFTMHEALQAITWPTI